MISPNPVHPLDNSCTVIFNHTLYSYAPTAFQKLRLEKNAKWKDMPMGVSIKGGVCVMKEATENSTLAAMYIVGGTSKSDEYHGLQRFIFATKTWETIIPSDPVLQNRLYHGAVYLKDSDSILVYSGTQNGNKSLSSQTFTIQASKPYQVLAYQSTAPPAIMPLLLSWTDKRAIYFGGSRSNQKAMIFDPSTSWIESNITLAEPIFDAENAKSAIVTADDSSKILYLFDLCVYPNTVKRMTIVGPDGKPIQNAKSDISQENQVSAENESESSAVSWPAYNDSLAPKSARNSYAISQDPSGLIVFSGGSTTDIVSIFKAQENRWEDTSEFFNPKEVSQIGTEATTSSASVTSEVESTSAQGQAVTVTSKFPTKILAIALGTIFFCAILFITFLVFCRRRKKKSQRKRTNDLRRASNYDEKDGMDFMDRSDSNMTLEKVHSKIEETNGSILSISSKAVLRGRRDYKQFNKEYGAHKSSQISKSAISKPILLNLREGEDSPTYLERTWDSPPPEDVYGSRRSSGWNRYWSGDNGRANPESNNSNSNTYMTDENDSYLRSSRDSSTLGDRPPDIYTVSTGSPTVAYNVHQNTLEGEIKSYIYEQSSKNYR